jgi:hypothetical protein
VFTLTLHSDKAASTHWPLPELNFFHTPPGPALIERQRALTWFALLMLLCALAAVVIAMFDDRVIRGANLWLKPIKFMLSTAVFALTTAWLMGLLAPVQRQTMWMKIMVWVLISTALFEVVYITGSAAWAGQSHHNTSSAWRATIFGAMAIAAVALTATQAALAWMIWRHAPAASAASMPVAAQAVLLGLLLTWLLGTASGFLLGGKQPPMYGDGALPLLGWHGAGGDGRPAHFLGLHAHQLLPLLGYLLQRHIPQALSLPLLWASTAAYVGAWWWLMRLALR